MFQNEGGVLSSLSKTTSLILVDVKPFGTSLVFVVGYLNILYLPAMILLVLKQLNDPPIRLITYICNAVLCLDGVYPDTWKVAQIIVIPKPGKPAEEITSYRPISLLPI